MVLKLVWVVLDQEKVLVKNRNMIGLWFVSELTEGGAAVTCWSKT